MARNGILCLEGDWEEGLKRERSVVPVLQLIQGQWDVPFIHRTASTRDEFRNVVQEWLKAKYSNYPILYLGFHGLPGILQIGNENIPIVDLYEFADRGTGRLIHFGACETLNAPRALLNHFLKMTRFTAICGFKHEVDWLHTCALEILILDELSKREISARNMKVFKSAIKKVAGNLTKELGFQVWERGRLLKKK